MKNKGVFFLLLSLILTMFISTITVMSANSSIKSLTLKEAYKIALERAIKWNPQAQLYSLTSVDNEENITEDLNGKRRFWNFQFGIINSNEHLIITIHDGKIVNFVPTKVSNTQDKLISPNDVKVDSIDILKKAKAEFNLSPGKDWAKGYHFTLNKIDNQTIMEVIGLDDNGYFTRMSYDSFTGQFVSAIHKVPFGGGFFTSDFEILLGEDKPIGLQGACLSSNFINDNLLIVWGFIDPYTPNDLPIAKMTNNQGLSWKSLNLDEPIIKICFSNTFDEDNLIYAITYNSVLKTTTLGKTWEKMYDINSFILGVDCFDKNIALLTEEGLHLTQDGGNTWSLFTVPKGTRHVAINSNSLIIATEKELFKMISQGWDKLEVAFSNDVIGLMVCDNNIITYTDKAINIINQSDDSSKSIHYEGIIRHVYLDFNFRDNKYLYILSNDNLLTRVGGDSDEIICLESIRSKEENLLHFLSGPNDKIYFITSTEAIWSEIKKEEF